MDDSQKLSRIRWAIRDILQLLKNDRPIPRSRVQKAIQRLDDANFGKSARMLEAEFQPVFGGRKRTPELLSFVQSLFNSIDDAVSQRINDEISIATAVGAPPESEANRNGNEPTGDGLDDEEKALETASTQTEPAINPIWDRDKRELSFNGVVIRKFAANAKNCIAVLTEFERLGWPFRIVCPLKYSCQSKRGQTAVSLRGTDDLPIQFNRDGDGGYCWRVVESPEEL